jgi:pimeloyl-ACP methyl ester carboxylesterase
MKLFRSSTINGPFTPRSMFAVAGVGAALAASALLVRHRTRKTERAHPPLGRFLEVDGVRLHYIDRGDGEPLVLLHGNGTMIDDMTLSGLVDLAAKRYRVIVFDRPGFGHSARPGNVTWTPQAQARLLRQALRQLGVVRPIVLGHSWGTLVALALALDYPASVRSLVLVSGYYFPTLRLDVPLFSVPAIPILGHVLRHSISPWLGRLLWPAARRKLFGPPPVPKGFDAFPVWMTLRPSQLRAAAGETALMIGAARALSRRYSELEMPVVICTGENDRLVKKRQSERLHKALPDSELSVVPGMGHMIHHLVPDDVMAAIDVAARQSALVKTKGVGIRDGFRAAVSTI